MGRLGSPGPGLTWPIIVVLSVAHDCVVRISEARIGGSRRDLRCPAWLDLDCLPGTRGGVVRRSRALCGPVWTYPAWADSPATEMACPGDAVLSGIRVLVAWLILSPPVSSRSGLAWPITP
ncbi:hypothetical protein HZH66_002607 [Vespula vulgaris]|uniref:Secreted protein n=1 Tax=Vespula vulgaris TaxID=7454 RepID=A0A834KK24_VESVU|nr:hypothetical protein HZH66_002607 [Vespula vulgaris]